MRILLQNKEKVVDFGHLQRYSKSVNMNKSISKFDENAVRLAFLKISEFMDAVTSGLGFDDVEAQAVALKKTFEILNTCDDAVLENDTVSDSSFDVLFALNPETSSWAAAGVKTDEVALWKSLDFSPEEARRWLDENLSVSDAVRWARSSSVPYYMRRSIDPDKVRDWNEKLFPAAEALQWVQLDISSDRVSVWVGCGGGIESGRTWLTTFPDVNPEVLYALSCSPLSVDTVKRYADSGVPVDQSLLFSQKGYTPGIAGKMVGKGETAETVKDRTGSEPVPGKAWLKIKRAAIENMWSVAGVDVVSGRSGQETRVTFQKGTEKVYAYFRVNRFVRGTTLRTSWWDKRTTIRDFIKDYL
jgi:hypothetical protein